MFNLTIYRGTHQIGGGCTELAGGGGIVHPSPRRPLRLYKKVPADVPMYIGPMAKEILKILISRLDYISGKRACR